MLKAIQLLLAKFEELQEIRRLKMSIYSMSPRSFYGLNKKLTFVQDICRKFMYRLKHLCEQNIDLLD